MFPLLSILIALTLGLTYRQMVPPGALPDYAGVTATILGVAVAGKVLFTLATRSVVANQRVAALFGAAFQVRMLVVLGYAAIVYVFHWPALVDVLGIGGWILVDELLVVAPFFLMLLIVFQVTWAAEHALDLHDFGLLEYVLFQTRQLLLPVFPILLFVLVGDLVSAASSGGVRWVAEAKIVADSYPFVQWIGFGSLFLLLYCAMPFAMRFFWGLKPLPDGPVRERLMEYSRREGFKAREILLWPTGGNILNAAVVGIAGRFRYVLMTDSLVENLDLDEVEAVFAHEVGHAKHNHLLKFFLFFLGYTLLMYLVIETFEQPLTRLIGDSILGSLAFAVGAIFLWFGLLMGFVSRRFEQQADVYGALSTGGLHELKDGEHPFVRALERIALQMGDIREMKGWRHFSLGSRIEFIEKFISDPAERRSYRRRIAGLLVFFFGLLGTIGVAAAFTVPRQIREGRETALVKRARWLEDHGHLTEAFLVILRSGKYRFDAGPVDREKLRLEVMRLGDRTNGADVHAVDRLDALIRASRGYLELDMPHAALISLEDARMMTAETGIMPAEQVQVLELMGWILKELGHLRGAKLAFEDALAFSPPESPRAARLRALIIVLSDPPDPARNR